MKERIIGFDLARAYAIFGMYIVNFNIVFGSYHDESGLGKLLSMFSGNSSTLFVMLAGMGVALMTNRSSYSREDKTRLKYLLLKRALFLFLTGLLLSLWWPADILHFYGGYMTIAAFLLFLPRKYYLWVSVIAILVFHGLLFLYPFETNWNFGTLQYHNYWTLKGFALNFVYNGWNAVFPWLAYFTTGMYLGRLNWSETRTQKRVFLIGMLLYLPVTGLQYLSGVMDVSEGFRFLINADYLPPLLPFLISTTGFGFMMIAAFMFLGNVVKASSFAVNMARTGQMTLTHYISHLTIGMLLLALLTGRSYAGHITGREPVAPLYILFFSVAFFIVSYYFSKCWSRKFEYGPFESLMRTI